ncbi:PrsW family intramembrane metalloprotease [Gryllotalpicola ginsengisoli]|uniref:PrsW family intramembrane metalloprotease n=1 Tax=Gryllotalpicola ginsengisoli TaxID=444608 RepID=UPI0003B5252B|nr:PrsW family intramembrane metalloprotease [Gryllotalpicola ginsengisoli]
MPATDPLAPPASTTGPIPTALPAYARPRAPVGSLVAVVVGICAAAMAVMWVVSYLVTVLGVVGVAVNGLVALVPLVAVLAVVRWVDRWEPEPFIARAFAFLWGAGVSIFAALVVDQTLNEYGNRIGVTRDQLFTITVQSPIVEEIAKGVGVLIIFLLAQRTFDGPVDGVVYAATIAAGFAFVENIQYFGLALVGGGEADLAYTFYVRGILSPFAHLVFTSCTGIALGIAVRTRRSRLGTAALFAAGLVAAILLHAGFNLGSAFDESGAFFFYLIVELPIFAVFTVFVLFARRRDAALTYENLSLYARAGWFTAAEVDMLGTVAGRRQARRWAKRRGGAARKAVRRFIRDATALAYARRRIVTGRGRERARQDERRLLRAVTADREAVLRS